MLQQLGDLDGVQGGAFAQVVGDDPEVDGVVVGEIVADAAHQNVIGPGGVYGEGVLVLFRTVHDPNSGRICQYLANLIGIDRHFCLDI